MPHAKHAHMLLCAALMVLTAFLPAPSRGQINDTDFILAFDVHVPTGRIAIGHRDRSISMHDLTTQDGLFTIPEPEFAVGSSTSVAFRVSDLAFSPDGQKFAVSFSGTLFWGLLRVYDSVTGELLNEFTPGLGVFDLDWSPAGNRIAATYFSEAGTAFSAHVGVWDVTDESVVTDFNLRFDLPVFVRSGGMAVAWSPDGSQLAFEAESMYVWDTNTWQDDAIIATDGDVVIQLQWNPAGDRLSSVDSFGTLRIYDIASGREIHMLQGTDTDLHYQHFSWSPSGEQIAVTAGDVRKIRIWDTQTGEIITTIDVGDPVTDLQWAEDGTIYYTVFSSFTIQTIDAETLESR